MFVWEAPACINDGHMVSVLLFCLVSSRENRSLDTKGMFPATVHDDDDLAIENPPPFHRRLLPNSPLFQRTATENV